MPQDAFPTKKLPHVRNFKQPREEQKISTWGQNKTSEESNETSEVLFCAYVENKKPLRGKSKISTEESGQLLATD